MLWTKTLLNFFNLHFWTHQWNSVEKEEKANIITHGLGFLLCLIGIPYLMYKVFIIGGLTNIASAAIYSLSLLLVYGSSTIYHSVAVPKIKRHLRLIDHCCIFFLIAGTPTPFLVMVLKSDTSYFLFGLWILVLLGILFKVIVGCGNREILSLFLYIVMGCASIWYVPELLEIISSTSMAMLAIGGLAYLVGVVFYAWDSLMYNHAIWHLFVIAGSMFHFIALLFELPQGMLT